MLGRNPIFTIATTLTLALAIGGTTAMFTVVDAALLRPLPFAEPEDLVWSWEVRRDTNAFRCPRTSRTCGTGCKFIDSLKSP